MAMPPGNVTPSEKLQFPPVAGNWIPDERDGFISWLRAEFAAANAIIDSLCQHLQTIGDHNEYESAIASIHHRRLSWSQVLVMQQFYPVAEVSYNLQQIAWKRQQQMPPPQRHYNSDQVGKFGGRRSGPGFNKHHHGGVGGGYRGADSMARNGHSYNSDYHSVSNDRVENREEAKLASDDKALFIADEKRDGIEKPRSDSKVGKKLEESETQVEIVNHNLNSAFNDNSLRAEQKQEGEDKACPASMATTFIVQEMYEAKMVNVVEGLKLYEKMLDANEVSQLVYLVNNLRTTGRRGQLQSEAYVAYKRPNRGHGRERIQLGLPIADMPPDDESIKDRRIEPIPSALLDIIERLVSKQIIPVKPDACIIDFFNEGDHSQPHMYVPWFGRPVAVLSLSECDLTFGRVIVSDQPGDYTGSLKLSLTPGSVLLVEGKSADLAKYAIRSTRKQRILITFTKSQPRNSITRSNWGPPPSRSPNHHNSVQPIFIAPSPPLAPPMPFPGGVPPGPTGWPMLPPHPRHQPPPQPRMPIPGTGVFLPPGSTQEQVSQGFPEKPDSSNGSSNSTEGKLDLKTKQEACNRIAAAGECDGSNGKQSN
ncbi:RNA demethylase ALKBH10B [Cardamine amara subsp. amara]|uniref:RNA demethylase ALKBH10B n=1 Tax=Cardamine amara subsp. amara TaxID=228776 RepID=A0ABD1ABX6_CARAN